MPEGRWAVRSGQRGCGRPMVRPLVRLFRRSGHGDLCGVVVGHGRGAGGGEGVGQGKVAVVVHVHQKDQLRAPLEVSRLEGRRRARSLPVRVAGQEDLGGSREDHVCRRGSGKAGTATATKGCRRTRRPRCCGCRRQRQGGSGLGLRGWRPSPRRGRFGCSSVRWA
jgi:hypothetical protein